MFNSNNISSYRLARVLRPAIWIAAVGICASAAYAQPAPKIVKLTIKDAGIARPVGGGIFDPKKGETAFDYYATFLFHDPEPNPPTKPDLHTALKIVKNLGGANQEVGVKIDPKGATKPTATDTITYKGPEKHGTTGSVDFEMGLSNQVVNNQNVLTSANSATLHLDLGKEGSQVSVQASVRDPFSFSDTDPNAMFGGLPEGILYEVGIGDGTAFPTVFSSGPKEYGAIASGTGMNFTGRVATGVYDGAGLWADGIGSDLYHLALSIDPISLAVHADLTFGAISPDFTVTYYDKNGNAFDPMNASAVSALETSIENGFVDGALTSGFGSFMSMKVVPVGDTGFTIGKTFDATVAGPEPVPGPATAVSFGLGSLGVWVRRRRSRVCPLRGRSGE